MSISGFRAKNHPQQTGKRGAVDSVDDRRTPDSIWVPLNREFGFSLDVAASKENAKCAKYFTIEENGLDQSWSGETVWCNPPYSDCRSWVEKAWMELMRIERPKAIVMLLPANRTEQKWWQELVEPMRDRGWRSRPGLGRDLLSTRFLSGRPRFDVPVGTYADPRGNRPPFGCVLLIWRCA